MPINGHAFGNIAAQGQNVVYAAIGKTAEKIADGSGRGPHAGEVRHGNKAGSGKTRGNIKGVSLRAAACPVGDGNKQGVQNAQTLDRFKKIRPQGRLFWGKELQRNKGARGACDMLDNFHVGFLYRRILHKNIHKGEALLVRSVTAALQ